MREAAKVFFGLHLVERIRDIFWRPIVKPGGSGKITARIKVIRDEQASGISLIPVNRNRQAVQLRGRETKVSRLSAVV